MIFDSHFFMKMSIIFLLKILKIAIKKRSNFSWTKLKKK